MSAALHANPIVLWGMVRVLRPDYIPVDCIEFVDRYAERIEKAEGGRPN